MICTKPIMRLRLAKALLAGGALAASLLCSMPAKAQTTYAVRDLGTVRHGSARVHDINLAGQAVGESGYAHGTDTHAFFWSAQGGLRDLGTLDGGDYSAAFAMNNADQVVGASNTQNGIHAFLWTNQEGLTDLGTLPGTNSSLAYGINAHGQVVGVSGAHATLWTGTAIQDLGTLGGLLSEAHGINNSGQVVGTSAAAEGSHAFLWSHGAMRDLGVLPGDAKSAATRISGNGTVIGASEGPNGTRAFVWTGAAGMQPVAPLAANGYSEAFGVNNLGQVVGQFGSSLGLRAFLWTAANGIEDLNEAVPGLAANIVLIGAFAINDQGQIVAFGVVNPNISRNSEVTMDSHIHSGPTRVFLLTPE